MKKLISLLLLSVTILCHAEPIEFVVSASAGGPNDTVTRKIVDKLEKQTNLQFVIVNKPGAAHVIAYNYVMNSNKPTLIMETPEIVDNEVFSHVDELFNAGYFGNIVFVSSNSSVRNLKQLTQLSVTRDIKFGHGGVGSYSHLGMEMLCSNGLRCLDVPYKSAAEGMMAILTNTIDAYAIVSYGSQQFLENDKYSAIHYIKLPRSKSWYKIFTKNVSSKDKETILNVLKTLDDKFYTDMGLRK